jgi:hypothetical protein
LESDDDVGERRPSWTTRIEHGTLRDSPSPSQIQTAGVTVVDDTCGSPALITGRGW